MELARSAAVAGLFNTNAMNIAIILSGGIGSRMGADIPKQYMDVGGKPVIIYCIEQFARSGSIDSFIISLDEQWKKMVGEHLSGLGIQCPVFYSCPGETRQFTIYHALKCAIANGFKDDDIVVIHDAARPLVSVRLIDSCIHGCLEYDGALPVLPMKDTVYFSEDGVRLSGVPPRAMLFAGQAPEAFRLGKYWKAHEMTPCHEILAVNGSTELAYKAGMNVKIIAGDEMNFKITTPMDLQRFKRIIEDNEG